MSARKLHSRFTVRDTDPLVREHRVEDIHILPGVSLLDALYKTLAAVRCAPDTVILRDVLFHEPVVTSERIDRRLTVAVTLDEERGSVTVSSQPWKGDSAVSSEATVHMTCEIARVAASPLAALAPVHWDDDSVTEDLDCCYHVVRHVGIQHDEFMQCTGRVKTLSSGDLLARAALGKRAAARAGDFLLHPVFLDCSTIVPLFNLRQRTDEASLFIPFAIEEFYARALTGRREVLVRVREPDASVLEREVLCRSFDIHGLDGQPLARFGKFAVKRVRSLANVRQLRESGLSARASHAAPAAPPASLPPAAASAARSNDPLIAHIGALVESIGKVQWNGADLEKPFFDLGLDSLALLDISEKLEQQLKVRLYPTLLFERSTVKALAAYLRETFPAETARLGGSAVCDQAAPLRTAKTAAAGECRPAPELLVPRWQAVSPGRRPENARIALLGESCHEALIDQLAQRLGTSVCYRACGASYAEPLREALSGGLVFDEAWLIGPDHDQAYALIQTLIAAGRLHTPLALRAFTVRAYSVLAEAPDEHAGHGVWGLWQSVSREYPEARATLVDLDTASVEALMRGVAAPWTDRLLHLDAPQRGLLAIRDGTFYERRLFRTKPATGSPPLLRDGGVYLIIGGAGGVGMAFLQHLRQRYRARVAVMGRRAPALLHPALAAAGEYGKDVLYVQGSVDSADDIRRAMEEVRARFGALHGVVHSAMVLADCRLSEMSRDDYDRVLRPKVEGIRALALASADSDLDFLLFFSSVQSFVGNASQANYAAASTFLDGFAGALRARRPYPVIVVNWGFWGELGAVATEQHRRLLARQGMHGLRAEEAFAHLETMLAGGWDQALVICAEDHLQRELGLSEELIFARTGRAGSTAVFERFELPVEELVAARRVFNDTEAAIAALLELARRRVRSVLDDLQIQDVEEAAGSRRLAPEHGAIVRVLRKIVSRDDEPAAPMSSEAFVVAIANLAQANPGVHDFIPLLQACLSALPQILGGRCKAADVVFPDGTVDLVEAVYGNSPISAFYNRLVARAVVTVAAQQPARPLRILEVGAGVGATSVEVLNTLHEMQVPCEYWYTDLWDKLVADARVRFGTRYPQMHFRLLDVGSDPAAQGLEERFDIVVATNVLHAARNLRSALRHVKRLLRPGGALVLNESVQAQEYSVYTFGLLPGWWTTTADAQLRLADSPLASRDTWMRLMREEGYAEPRLLVPAGDHHTALGAQEVFIAWSDGEVRLPARTLPARDAPKALSERLQPITLGELGVAHLPALRRLRLYRDQHRDVWLFLDNPPANTFSMELLDELCTVLELLQAQSAEALDGRIVYLSHCGSYFSLGGDRNYIINMLSAGRDDAIEAFADKARRLLTALATLNALVVAVVNGTAQGAGLETLFATDLQLVARGVKIGLPEIKSGLLPGMGGLSYLRNQIGAARTKRLVLGGELIEAGEAYELGLISHVVDDPVAAAFELRERVAHVETAIYAKQMLGADLAGQLTADIDKWLAYVLRHRQWIDARRIADSEAVLRAQLADTAV